MKTAILYYSLTGNTETAAKAMAETTGADLFALETIKPMPKRFFCRIILGGFGARFKKKPAIKPIAFTPANYDRIIIGTPTWAGTIAPAVRTALTKFDFTSRSVALFSTFAGAPSETISAMTELLGTATVIGSTSAKEPSKNPDSLVALKLWAAEIAG